MPKVTLHIFGGRVALNVRGCGAPERLESKIVDSNALR